jgi:hypothetical protein
MNVQVDGKVHGLFMKAKKQRTLYPKTTTTAAHVHMTDVQIDPADADIDKPCLVLVEVTEVFADGTGAQPTFKIGQTGTAEKFIASALLTGATVGQRFVGCGMISCSSEAELLVTATVATGTGTGAIRVTAVVFPAR